MPGLQHVAGRRAFLTAVIIGQRLLATAAINFNSSSYARNVSLDAGVDIFWTINGEAGTIRVAVHAKDATGWASVGISEMGGMEGSDIVFYEAATGEVTDAHAIVAGAPVRDECTQDWNLLSSDVGSGGLVFEAERALDTGDAQDRALVDDTEDGVAPTRLIAARGDSEVISYHGTQLFAKAEVVLFGGEESSSSDTLSELKSTPGVSFFDLAVTNFTIPPIRTHYEDICIPASALPDLDEFHIVGFEDNVQEANSQYVHHLIVRGFFGVSDCGSACEEWQQAVTAAVAANSTETPEMPPECSQVDFADIIGWAPGMNGVVLPKEVGFRFGNASGGFSSFGLSTHYNNPNEDTGVVDNSGVRVYFTEELRAMDMGILALGDPSVTLAGTPISDGKTSISFGCPSSCTEGHFEADNVTIFSHFLHMHENGRRLQTRLYRNDSLGDEMVVHSAEVDFYSFEQAGGHTVGTNGTITIQKGDRFETECFYDTALSSVGSENVSFGFGSENEMCIDFVAYFPRQNIPRSSCGLDGLFACRGAVLGTVGLAADSDFNRTFGTVHDTCVTGEEENGELSLSSSVALAGAAGLWPIAMPLVVGTLLPLVLGTLFA